MAPDAGEARRAALEALIVEKRERTAQRLTDLTRTFDDILESSAIAPPDDEHDPEGATVAFERAQTAAMIDQAQRQRSDLQQALERLQAGNYGVCQRCRNPIAFERLLARPTATTCVHCAAGSPRV